MKKERILITVKTYPTLSKKYGETVCTAGIKEDGSWVRIYPVPFRRLDQKEQYSKFDWIECRLSRNQKDPRPETYRAHDSSDFQPVGHIGTEDKWHDRRKLVLGKCRVFTRLDELIEGAKANRLSLAVFKPTKILDFIWEEEDREWDPKKLRQMREQFDQLSIFEEENWRETFEVIPKLPFSFSYRFEDETGRQSELQVLDWEAGALFWNCLKSANGDENVALSKVRQKYFDTFRETDLHFFLGTTQEFHFRAPNPWVIIGVFPAARDDQMRMEIT